MKARAQSVGAIAPGSALAVVIALAATFLTELHGGPQMLYALFLGVAFHYLSEESRTIPGIDFCSRQVLHVGVGLLGARITAEQIAGLGWFTALAVISAVVTTISCGLLMARWLGMTRAQGVLSGGAVAICGASAAMAISAVLPRQRHHERFTLVVVITVTVLSTVAMVLYPLVARALDLGPELAGLFIGGTIHDVAQVVGAGFTLGPQTGEIATIVKLFRVAMLAAVVMAVSVAFKQSREEAAVASPSLMADRQPLIPWFLWLFIALVAVNSAGALTAALQDGLGWLSRACLVVAIAALGMKTSLKHLTEAGWRPVLLILFETLWMAALVIGLILSRL